MAIYDFGEHEEQPFIVMRYMPGGTLADRLRDEGPLPAEEAARILTQIGSALDEAHSQGIVHRDLKPGNILFDHRGDAAIADFGIVKIAESTHTLTGTGMIGTPGYMSPEQARGDTNIDRRSDIYALGAILFEMLTGQLPYQADTPMGIAIKHVIDDVPHILTIKPDLPPALDGVIIRAMAKEPDGRYGSATELAVTITSVATAATRESAKAVDVTQIEIPAPRPTPQPPKPTRRPTPKPQDQDQTQIVPAPTAAPPRPASQPRATPVPAAPPSPAEKGRSIPTWLWVVGGLFILLLCVGGVVGGAGIFGNILGGSDETATPTTEIAAEPTMTTAVNPGSSAASENNIFAEAQAATVQVTALGSQYLEELIGSGSGIVFNENGLVLTNYHLVEGAETIEILGSEGQMTTAEIVGTSPCDDLAILRLDDLTFPVAPVPTSPDDIPSLSNGDAVFILGYPQNSAEQTQTAGTVSATGQPVAAAWGNFPTAIQINATPDPGQSGAPLITEDGNIIGITTIPLESDESTVIALPLGRIRPILLELQQENNPHWIGLNVGPLPDSADLPSQEGLFVFAVAPDSPAEAAGIEPGDFITGLGNSSIGNNDTDETLDVYCRELRNYEDGDILDINIQRGDETLMGQINGRPLTASATETPTPTPSSQPSATLRPTNTSSPTPGQPTNTAVPPTNTPAPPTATSVPPTQPPPTQPPPTQPPPTQPPPTQPPPTQPPPTNTAEPP